MGDSKTNISGWREPLATMLWPGAIVHGCGIGGATVASYDWPYWIATVPYNDVSWVLVNLGVNPSVCASPPTDEAMWKADYQEGIDAIHTRWPGARIALAKPWAYWGGVDCDATYDTLAGWIDDLVATCGPTCLGGLDERDSGPGGGLEQGDNGATNYLDEDTRRVHYSEAGKLLVAQLWADVMGY